VIMNENNKTMNYKMNVFTGRRRNLKESGEGNNSESMIINIIVLFFFFFTMLHFFYSPVPFFPLHVFAFTFFQPHLSFSRHVL
jgi:hypothetical protein